MARINIGGMTHVTETAGKTLCGVTYPKSWPTTSRNITCEHCYHILKVAEEAALAEARKAPAPCDEPGIPF